MASIDDFNKLDIRVGRVISVEAFPEARKPAYKLIIDLGQDLGLKKSSAQIVENYTREFLINRLVLCVINFPPRQIGPFISEVLTLGIPDENGKVVLVEPEHNVPLGGRLF